MTPREPETAAGQADSMRRRAPLNSVSTRIILCVFFSTLLTALIVSWLSIGAIHEDVRRRTAARAEQILDRHAAEIEAGEVEERDLPSEKFILKASGVGHRYFIEKEVYAMQGYYYNRPMREDEFIALVKDRFLES